jgi:hypothetical protein
MYHFLLKSINRSYRESRWVGIIQFSFLIIQFLLFQNFLGFCLYIACMSSKRVFLLWIRFWFLVLFYCLLFRFCCFLHQFSYFLNWSDIFKPLIDLDCIKDMRFWFDLDYWLLNGGDFVPWKLNLKNWRIKENELNLERERERNPRNWGRGG